MSGQSPVAGSIEHTAVFQDDVALPTALTALPAGIRQIATQREQTAGMHVESP